MEGVLVRGVLQKGLQALPALEQEQALHVLGLCLSHPETYSDTQRDIQLVLEELRKIREDDIEAGLERGKLLDINHAVITALGG